MKQKLLVYLATITGFLGIAGAAGATSTVMLDPPDISTMINSIYNIAQPVFNSISGWVWVFLGFAFVFFVVRFLVGLFNR